MKTKAEIEELKERWEYAPTWNIEDAHGFEDHRSELIEYRESVERQWRQQHQEQINALAVKLGIPQDLFLAEHLLMLELQISIALRQLSNLAIENAQLKNDLEEAIGRHVHPNAKP